MRQHQSAPEVIISSMSAYGDESRPLEEQMPPPVAATPEDVTQTSGEEIRWWRPGWQDVVHHVGWRWILLSPAIGLALIYAASWYLPISRNLMWMLQFKILVFEAGIAISLAAYVVRKIIRARQEPFCIFCGYDLSTLPKSYRCPECGRPYTWDLIAEYRRDPQWFIERWRLRNNIPTAQPPFAAGAIPRKNRNRDGTE